MFYVKKFLDICRIWKVVNFQSELSVKTQSVPRSKHTPSLLYKPVS
jgi:hypothetical protein